MNKLITTLHSEMIELLEDNKNHIARDNDFIEIKDKISVAIGMRRTGKTGLMMHKIRELINKGIEITRIIYIDFEDDRLEPLNQQRLAEILDGFYSTYPENHNQQCFLFLDEIQTVDGWAKVVRRFFNSKNVQIYLSGSSAKLLSKEIATELRGRSIATEVWPFSFNEFLHAMNINTPEPIESQTSQDILKKHLLNYIHCGGFPGITAQSNTNRSRILQEYIDVVIIRDIIERHNISNAKIIHYMISYLLKNAATSFSTTKFHNDLKSQGFTIGRATVQEYLDYIEDAYLAFTVPLYSESLRKTQTNPRKVYAIDTGLIRASSLFLTDNIGRLFENLVYIELRRRSHKIFYYLTNNRHEVDFLTQDLEGNSHLYQVAWDISDPQTLTREQRSLDEAENELGIKGKIITPENFLTWVINT